MSSTSATLELLSVDNSDVLQPYRPDPNRIVPLGKPIYTVAQIQAYKPPKKVESKKKPKPERDKKKRSRVSRKNSHSVDDVRASSKSNKIVDKVVKSQSDDDTKTSKKLHKKSSCMQQETLYIDSSTLGGTAVAGELVVNLEKEKQKNYVFINTFAAKNIYRNTLPESKEVAELIALRWDLMVALFEKIVLPCVTVEMITDYHGDLLLELQTILGHNSAHDNLAFDRVVVLGALPKPIKAALSRYQLSDSEIPDCYTAWQYLEKFFEGIEFINEELISLRRDIDNKMVDVEVDAELDIMSCNFNVVGYISDTDLIRKILQDNGVTSLAINHKETVEFDSPIGQLFLSLVAKDIVASFFSLIDKKQQSKLFVNIYGDEFYNGKLFFPTIPAELLIHCLKRLNDSWENMVQKFKVTPSQLEKYMKEYANLEKHKIVFKRFQKSKKSLHVEMDEEISKKNNIEKNIEKIKFEKRLELIEKYGYKLTVHEVERLLKQLKSTDEDKKAELSKNLNIDFDGRQFQTFRQAFENVAPNFEMHRLNQQLVLSERRLQELDARDVEERNMKLILRNALVLAKKQLESVVSSIKIKSGLKVSPIIKMWYDFEKAKVDYYSQAKLIVDHFLGPVLQLCTPELKPKIHNNYLAAMVLGNKQVKKNLSTPQTLLTILSCDELDLIKIENDKIVSKDSEIKSESLITFIQPGLKSSQDDFHRLEKDSQTMRSKSQPSTVLSLDLSQVNEYDNSNDLTQCNRLSTSPK